MRALVFLFAPIGPLSAQQPQRITLGAKTGELKHAMSQITSVRELRDGRVLVLDAREREVYLADLNTQTMPPFVGREALLMAPDGHLWVARTKNVTDPVQTYDVFDDSGRLTGRAELPSRRRIVGFGAREVYVVHRDADDLEYPERYRR